MKTSGAKYWIAAVSFAVMMNAGCKKKAPADTVVIAVPASTTAPASATPVAAVEPPAPPAPVGTPSTDGVTATATTGDGKSVDWALKQDDIKNDPQGQWASGATASSTYSDAKDKDAYSAWQATGAPNTDTEGDRTTAWAQKSANLGIEWLDVSFAKPVAATGLRIRESCGAGAVVRVELLDDGGTKHALWTGTDPTKELNYFQLTFPKTSYKVSHARITLATNLAPGWHEIDAVQLLSPEK